MFIKNIVLITIVILLVIFSYVKIRNHRYRYIENFTSSFNSANKEHKKIY